MAAELSAKEVIAFHGLYFPADMLPISLIDSSINNGAIKTVAAALDLQRSIL
jgi:hypothetical protein